MKLAKSFLTGTGALVLAGLVLSLLAPKAAHAIAATMVLVENTAATPVPNSPCQNAQFRQWLNLAELDRNFASG
jgi:hypothetical protein